MAEAASICVYMYICIYIQKNMTEGLTPCHVAYNLFQKLRITSSSSALASEILRITTSYPPPPTGTCTVSPT